MSSVFLLAYLMSFSACTHICVHRSLCGFDPKDNFALFVQVIQSNARSKKLHVLFLDDTPINGQHSGQVDFSRLCETQVVGLSKSRML